MRKIQFKVTEAFKNSTKEKFALAMSINSVWRSFSYYRLLFVELSRLSNLCKEIVNLYISNRLSYTQHTIYCEMNIDEVYIIQPLRYFCLLDYFHNSLSL